MDQFSLLRRITYLQIMFEKLLFNVMNNKFAYVCTRLTIVIFYKLHASVILFKFFSMQCWFLFSGYVLLLVHTYIRADRYFTMQFCNMTRKLVNDMYYVALNWTFCILIMLVHINVWTVRFLVNDPWIAVIDY